MNKPMIAGNWKMNMLQSEAMAFFKDLAEKTKIVTHLDTIDGVICPPATLLGLLSDAARTAKIELGAQNCHWEPKGAFTGEISPAMIKDLGVKYTIIGHSERRQYFAETDESVNKRMLAALGAGLVPIVCIGEYLEDRKAGRTQAVIQSQVKSLLSSQSMSPHVVLAYEPVWAIGTGLAATPAQAEEVHALIRGMLIEALGASATKIRILYGGSMSPGNVAELLAMPNIDGGLIGGASLKPADYFSLLEAGIARALTIAR